MGKISRQRQKTSSSSSGINSQLSQRNNYTVNNRVFATSATDNKIIPGVSKSFKNLKNAAAQVGVSDKNKVISKKNKHKLKRNLLVQKINSLNELKKQNKERKKRKNNVIIGDTNSLHDALPSLDSLLQCKIKVSKPVKMKSIAKVAKRKKVVAEDVSIFKKILQNKHYKKNPLNLISEHVKQRVQSGEI